VLTVAGLIITYFEAHNGAWRPSAGLGCFPAARIHVMLCRRAAYCQRGGLYAGADFSVHGVGRDQLRHDLTRHNVEVKVQEDFKDSGTVTLDKLDVYIKNCDAVVHLVGDMTGAAAKSESTKSMLAKYPDLPD
jgi:hypothetical protein